MISPRHGAYRRSITKKACHSDQYVGIIQHHTHEVDTDFPLIGCQTPRFVVEGGTLVLLRRQLSIFVLSNLIAISTLLPASPSHAQLSVARQWNEELLEAIRKDYARPTVHARNLFHTSIAMWDSWAAYDPCAVNYLHLEKASAENVAAARRETISYSVYRILVSRFMNSPGAAIVLPSFDAKMTELGYDIANTSTVGDSPAALGNRIAAAVFAFGDADTSNEANGYGNLAYMPRNQELFPAFPGNPRITDPNLWQPLVLDFFIDQSGNPFPLGVPPFLSPEWGTVTPFALQPEDLTIYVRDGYEYWAYHDPGPPPFLNGVGDAAYRSGFDQVLEWSAQLDPADGVMIDISPASRGDNTLGTNDGNGREMNPKTGLPYLENIVPAGDYFRVLAEFWADGPASETPPGHWFTIANYVSDHPAVVKKIGGVGPILSNLEWDVKLYQALAGAVHDSAVAAWGAKGVYDYIRPISALRFMADQGQSTFPDRLSYDPDGIALVPGRVAEVTFQSIQPGRQHEHLGLQSVGKMAAKAWRGPDFISNPDTDTAGVGWILIEDWWPYQRPSFVTPPFAGYVSGHSTFSRAAAELMTLFTGDEYFPDGVGEFFAPKNEFLVFEEGPSVDVTLQWATYRDASDETSISRIYGGIHPTADDIPGRLMGAVIGPAAYELAESYWGPWKTLKLDKVEIKAAKKGKSIGKVSIRGKLDVGIYGDEDVLNLSDGVLVSIRDSQGATFEINFPNCKALGKRKQRCAGDDKKSYASFRKASGELVHFSVSHKSGVLPEDFVGPLVVAITTGDITRAGVSAHCKESPWKLSCKRHPHHHKPHGKSHP